jgi:hypothetical protein
MEVTSTVFKLHHQLVLSGFVFLIRCRFSWPWRLSSPFLERDIIIRCIAGIRMRLKSSFGRCLMIWIDSLVNSGIDWVKIFWLTRIQFLCIKHGFLWFAWHSQFACALEQRLCHFTKREGSQNNLGKLETLFSPWRFDLLKETIIVFRFRICLKEAYVIPLCCSHKACWMCLCIGYMSTPAQFLLRISSEGPFVWRGGTARVRQPHLKLLWRLRYSDSRPMPDL